MTDEGSLQSPGYPNYYPDDLWCEWNLTVASGNSIVLLFNEFHIQHSFFCRKDRVLVMELL